MTNENLEKFAEIMMGLAENYPGTRLTDTGLDMRFEALRKFSIDQVAKAATKLIQTHRYNTMPTTADIINAMGGQMPMGVDHRAELEAGKVLDVLRSLGTSATPSFGDPITRHLMNHRWKWYSWAARVKEDDLKWWHKDFIRAYRAQAAGIDAGVCLPLGELSQSIARNLAIGGGI